jgi:hypothetical protein
MPRIKKPPPYFMKHLVDRFREGRISVADFDALQDWLNSNPSSSLRPQILLFLTIFGG